MFKCKFCNKDCHNNGGLKSHEPHCKHNPNYVKRSTGSYGQSPWNKGLTTKTSEKVKQCKETYKKHFNEGKFVGSWTGKKHSIEFKQKMSEITKNRHAKGWDNKCGRAPKFKYHSDIAGDVTLDGSWELAVAKYLDKNKIIWKRNTDRFEYINLQGNKSFYKPDFYLINEDTYIEIKGYETDLDKCKWKQFPKKLKIWKKKDLLELSIL